MKKSNTIYVREYTSPCGEMIIGSLGDELCLCDWKNIRHRNRNDRRICRNLNAEYKTGDSKIIRQTITELDEYFAGIRHSFDIPIRLAGTEFQQKVWNALLSIPYGETKSYMHIARSINNPKGVRAVAQAIGANALSLIIPCYRIIGSNNTLTGFAGGLEAKKFLIELEKKHSVNAK